MINQIEEDSYIPVKIVKDVTITCDECNKLIYQRSKKQKPKVYFHAVAGFTVSSELVKEYDLCCYECLEATMHKFFKKTSPEIKAYFEVHTTTGE